MQYIQLMQKIKQSGKRGIEGKGVGDRGRKQRFAILLKKVAGLIAKIAGLGAKHEGLVDRIED